MPSGRPTVEIVIRRAPMPRPLLIDGRGQGRQQRVEIQQRLAHAHHHHVAEPFGSAFRSNRLPPEQAVVEVCSICSMISPAVRLRTKPSMPVAQKAQPIAQPTCVLMQAVQCLFVVAQQHALDPLGVGKFEQQFFGAVGRLAVLGDFAWSRFGTRRQVDSRRATGRSVISSNPTARFLKSHFRTCPARYAGKPCSTNQSRSPVEVSSRIGGIRQSVGGACLLTSKISATGEVNPGQEAAGGHTVAIYRIAAGESSWRSPVTRVEMA